MNGAKAVVGKTAVTWHKSRQCHTVQVVLIAFFTAIYLNFLKMAVSLECI